MRITGGSAKMAVSALGLLSLALALSVFCPKSALCAAVSEGHCEKVSGQASSSTAYKWRYAFSAGVSEGALAVRVGLHLVPAGGVTVPELSRAKALWESGAEKLWSRKFAVEDETGKRYPILVDIDFSGIDADHEIVVRPGRGRDDQLNWHLSDSAELVAHEVGHAFGIYDEYAGGATAPLPFGGDPQSIMVADPKPGARVSERHFGVFLEWFEKRMGLSAKLVPAVEMKSGNDGLETTEETKSASTSVFPANRR